MGNKKEKKTFKMPHLLWIMFGLIALMCLLTYIIPAGQFAVDENGKILGDQFSYLGHQTPVSPWQTLMLLFDGLTGSSTIIFTVMAAGAGIAVILDTGAVDDFLNWAIYKVKDKGEALLISILFILMVYLGGFGGSDALIAVVPIGLVFAKKLKLDPISALGVTTFATLIGFGTGPAKQVTTQMLMGVPAYSSFFTRFLSMNFFMAVGLFMVLQYVKKVRKNAANSIMYDQGWDPEAVQADAQEEEKLIKKVTLSWRTVVSMIVFFGQYLVIVAYSLGGGDSSKLYNFMLVMAVLSAVIVGFVMKMSAENIGKSFAKGLASMAFVGFVIGMARVLSLVMTEGNILHTIVYVLTRPLQNLPKSIANIGMTAVIALINPIIPSATSKAAILVPIIKPITETLQMNPYLAVMSFQFGDGFTNLISPVLGWTIGSCAMANVPFQKWLKWVLPKVLIFTLLSFVWIFVLSIIGWSGIY